MSRLPCLCCVITFVCALAARAETATFTPDKDNTIFQSATGNLSSGAGTSLYVGRSKQSGNVEIRRGLMHFNLSSIPAGAAITSASLRLFAENHGNNGNRTMILHRLDQDWGQGTFNSSGMGSQATANDATWLYRFYNLANPTASPTWATQGGAFEKADSGSAICLNAGGFFTFNSNLTMLSDLQSWAANPSSNFGWILLGDESGPGTAKKIYSRENAIAADRPTLTITYAVPEPSSLTILLAGIAIASLRRRPIPL